MNDAEYLNVLKTCVSCGTCKAQCPTYVTGRTEGQGARGRMRLLYALHEGRLAPSERLNDYIFGCALCGICDTQCPPGVDITGAVYHGRDLLRPHDTEPKRKRLRKLSGQFSKRPRLGFWAAKLAAPFLKGGRIPGGVSLPKRPLSPSARRYAPKGKKKGTVAVFAGCSARYLEPRLATALVRLLTASGFETALAGGELCCGSPLRALGLKTEAEGLMKKNLEALDALGADAVLSPCPTCTLELRAHLGERAMDPVQFLLEREAVPALSPQSINGAVSYHDPCHLRYGLGVQEAPRELIRRAGLELNETADAGCCGVSLVLTDEDMSDALLARRVRAFEKTGAGLVVTACPGCAIQLRRGGLKALHIVEALAPAAVGGRAE